MKLRLGAVSIWLGAAAACGGTSSPAAPARPRAPVAPVAPPSTPAEDEPPPPKRPAKTAADHHRELVEGCTQKSVNSPEYCECVWAEFRTVFSDDEMNAGNLAAEKLDTVKAAVSRACSSKIPESAVKDAFATTCIGKIPEAKSYCECTWTEYRKRFSAAELSDEATAKGDRFVAARGQVAKACASKMPESVSKEAFMSGCAKDAAAKDFCDCVWKELRKQASAADIQAGTFDQKTIFAKVEKVCGKLRPASK